MVAAPYEGGNDDDWDDDEEDWEDEDRDDDEDDWDEDENEDDWDEDEDEDDEYEAFYKQDEPGRIQPFRANRRFRDEDQGPRPHPKRKHHRPPRIKGAYDEDAPDEEDEPWDR